jgi:hypothetical protein
MPKAVFAGAMLAELGVMNRRLLVVLSLSAIFACGTSDDVVEDSSAVGDDARLPGGAALDAQDRAAFERLLARKNNLLSRQTRLALKDLEADTAYEIASPDEQATRLKKIFATDMDFTRPRPDRSFPGFLPPFAQVLWLIEGTPAFPLATEVPRISEPVRTTRVGTPPPKDFAAYRLKLLKLLSPNAGATSPSDLISSADYVEQEEAVASFTVSFATDSVTVTAPLLNGELPTKSTHFEFPSDDGSGAKLFDPSVEEIARALASVPMETRKIFSQVDVQSKRHWGDPIFTELNNGRPFRANMAAMIHPAGVFAIFPFTEDRKIDSMPDTMVHESGHVFAFRHFGLDPSSPGWTEWRAAMKSDRFHPSTYAAGSFLEDEAEGMLVYMGSKALAAKGSPIGADLAALFPARRAIFEREMTR